MLNYDFTKLSDVEFVPGGGDKPRTMIPAAYEALRQKLFYDLGEITDLQWGVIEMLVNLHCHLLEQSPSIPKRESDQ